MNHVNCLIFKKLFVVYNLFNVFSFTVLENIDNYSLEDIEAKLSVMCVRKKVSFSVEPETKPVSYSFNASSEADDDATPAWVKAALRVAKTLNN